MNVLMGGSSSSGTTLLREILNRHPDIFSGGELNFFNKEQLFYDWNKNKLKIIPIFPFFTTLGWTIYRRNALTNGEYNWGHKKEVVNLLKSSDTIKDFTNVYFKRTLRLNNKKLWIEKTPSNCYSFAAFLKTYPNGKVIHVVRDPYDTATSLLKNRKQSVLKSTGTWLYNNAAALACKDNPNYLLVKYEDLVTKPKETIKNVMTFLNIEFDEKVLLPNPKSSNDYKKNKWENDPNQPITTKALNKFDKLPTETRSKIVSSFEFLEISKSHQKYRDISMIDFDMLINYFGYQKKDLGLINKKYRKNISFSIFTNWMNRSIRFYATGWNFYPLKMKK